MNRAASPLGRAFAVTLAALSCSSANAQFSGFVDPVYFPLGAFNGALSNSFEIGDINNDGFNDVVVAYLNFQAVSVALSDGAGGFGTPTVLSTTFRPESPRLADVSGDGFLDLVLVSYLDETVEIFLGNGTGAFTPFASVPVAEGPIDSIFADFNNDGVLDLAVAHYPLSRLDIYLGTGAGQFQYGSKVLTTSEPLEIYLDDADNDGQRQGACEALYVRHLIIESGATLNTNGCPVYYETLTLNGSLDDPARPGEPHPDRQLPRRQQRRRGGELR